MEKVLGFLKELTENNNREWFNDNRKWYDESREKLLFLTDVLINEIGEFDPKVRGLSPKDCVFRIFRDVRFSNDKRPYKTNFGSFICTGGRKSMNPGYYFHLEPGSCFIAGGIYMPPAPVLKTIRGYMDHHAEEFLAIANDPEFKKHFPEMYDDKLKLAPKGFPKDHEYIELLKYKSFIFSKPLKDSLVTSEKYIEEVLGTYEQVLPVNQFLYEALAE
ncbi:DUF2461 domain-containing protein [Draconibacterium sp. IB214405]|uniref:DUF2461 domain-containing protein n=1 Tax=Draconibacterium sp. IB214405 TaxID=3097352 RepID=UPI002A158D09|nr:DUF2461 domain-containing protein [Draconibacterium sp. IB214405]MDX8338029.1 DUF2461 domain-containing protein [Draconibacterium sp. IB214405]